MKQRLPILGTNLVAMIGCVISLCWLTVPTAFATANKPSTEAATPTVASPPSSAQGYAHKWISAPQVTLKLLNDSTVQSLSVATGEVGVLVFIASYCEPCQQIIKQLQAVEKEYKPLNVRFFYIFSHDTEQDARSFAKEYRLSGAYLANHDVLKEYHNPELPSIYLIDKKGWLTTRYLQVTKQQLSGDLPTLLDYLTAF